MTYQQPLAYVTPQYNVPPPQYVQYTQPMMQTPPQQYQQVPVHQGQHIPQPEIFVPSYQPQQKVNTTNQNDSMTSAMFFALGFLLCCLWIMGYCRYRKSTDAQARSFAVLSLVFFIISTIIVVFVVGFFIVYFVIIFTVIVSLDY
ncbi:hypothetical protein EIN_127370 [Entamoeba invadens IP1]|uniref:Uncharacterized protein n=1 Tax=Entamoeba invadens IP1 TaxID=370355 RepID=A0A0A1TUR4_ENTIV|nr:hypothetical protein EIN_127370 [Entamoeba invadens IP1]ELP83867.1 hypothetical protein EIN_127370 [Entamoeba invadens IP1]|eukprot:XP_004183213.1 hypothetical protein EIN_127370 [Entamoeba invadens IP1]